MRILAVGASGMLGRVVATTLGERHDIVGVSRSTDPAVDLADTASIEALFVTVGHVDAVVCCAGVTPFAPLAELGLAKFRAGLDDKLLGQIALVQAGTSFVNDGGSFTLVSGILADEPIRTGAVASTVNGALHSFVAAAATELPRGLRINAVSPTVLTEAWDAYGDYFPGFAPTPAAEAARAFVKSVEGVRTGRIYRVGY